MRVSFRELQYAVLLVMNLSKSAGCLSYHDPVPFLFTRVTTVCWQVPSGRRPLGRPPGIDAKRKRAADFFAEDEAVRVKICTSSGHNHVGVRVGDLAAGALQPDSPSKVVRDDHLGKSDVVSRSETKDVLENAYHAAVALSNSLSARKRKSSLAYLNAGDDGDNGANGPIVQPDPLPSGRHGPTLTSTEPARHSDSALTAARATASAIQRIDAPVIAKGNSMPGESMEPTGRAVDAEGLIWVDESQGTAYSVRFVLDAGEKQCGGCSTPLRVVPRVR